MKITLNSLLVLLIAVTSACSKSDDNEPSIVGPTGNSYWPFAVGNMWNMVNPNNAEDKQDYIIHKSITHEGETYFQFKPIGTDADIEITNGVREDNGIFYELHGAVDNDLIDIAPGEIVHINTKLAVGEVWKDEVSLKVTGAATGTIKHVNEGKITEKAAKVTVNGKTYNDVIKTEVKKTVTNSIAGYSLTVIYETWLAKGVGIIYEKDTHTDSPAVTYSLTNYSLK